MVMLSVVTLLRPGREIRHGVGLLTRPSESLRFGLADNMVNMRGNLAPTHTFRTLTQSEITSQHFLPTNLPRSIVAALMP